MPHARLNQTDLGKIATNDAVRFAANCLGMDRLANKSGMDCVQ